ncbi:MAG TPA: hypothetical protein VNB29_05915 [Chthoniobacterales bacterium]|nr:hypothetical protein [Chthoniobacterales bacterium]
MIDFFTDLHRQRRIREANDGAPAVEASARDLQNDLRRLESRLDRLALASQAMWELLRERTDLTEDDILARIMEVDLRDGQADDKMSGRAVTCTSCGRKINSAHRSCIYCGEPCTPPEIFHTA